MLLVPILLAAVYQTLVVARRLWCDRYPYLPQRWLDWAKNVMGNDLIDGALIQVRVAPPRGQDRVLRRVEMIDAIRAERAAQEDARKAAAGVVLNQFGARRDTRSFTLLIA